MYVALSAIDEFEEFLCSHHEYWSQTKVLADYFDDWVVSGKAGEVCLGNFGFYAQTLVLVIVQWEANGRHLDFRNPDGTVSRRPIERITNLPPSQNDLWLDRERFLALSHPGRSLPGNAEL